MTSAKVVKTSVNFTSNSPSEDYTHPDDHNLMTYDMTPGFKTFTVFFKFCSCFLAKIAKTILRFALLSVLGAFSCKGCYLIIMLAQFWQNARRNWRDQKTSVQNFPREWPKDNNRSKQNHRKFPRRHAWPCKVASIIHSQRKEMSHCTYTRNPIIHHPS